MSNLCDRRASRMRRWSTALTALVMLAATVGCESRARFPAGAPPASSERRSLQPARAPQPLPLPTGPASALPADGPYRVGSIALVGHQRFVDNKKVGRPALWTTDAVIRDAGSVWRTLVDRYQSTGLYPVILQADDPDSPDGRPWLNGEFDLESRTAPGELGSPNMLFGRLYREAQEEFVADDLPQKTLTELKQTRTSGPDLGAARAASVGLPGRIGLVAVGRPADVPYAIGWLGATNYFDGGTVTAVLRSWEDRYGTQLVRMGFDYMQLSVPDPPRTLAAARKLALEHVAFDGDQVYQEHDGFDDYARSLVGATSWYFWWD